MVSTFESTSLNKLVVDLNNNLYIRYNIAKQAVDPKNRLYIRYNIVKQVSGRFE